MKYTNIGPSQACHVIAYTLTSIRFSFTFFSFYLRSIWMKFDILSLAKELGPRGGLISVKLVESLSYFCLAKKENCNIYLFQNSWDKILNIFSSNYVVFNLNQNQMGHDPNPKGKPYI